MFPETAGQMSDSASVYDEDDDDYSERTEDTLDRLLQSYTFNFKPEVRLKWHKRYVATHIQRVMRAP